MEYFASGAALMVCQILFGGLQANLGNASVAFRELEVDAFIAAPGTPWRAFPAVPTRYFEIDRCRGFACGQGV